VGNLYGSCATQQTLTLIRQPSAFQEGLCVVDMVTYLSVIPNDFTNFLQLTQVYECTKISSNQSWHETLKSDCRSGLSIILLSLPRLNAILSRSSWLVAKHLERCVRSPNDLWSSASVYKYHAAHLALHVSPHPRPSSPPDTKRTFTHGLQRNSD